MSSASNVIVDHASDAAPPAPLAASALAAGPKLSPWERRAQEPAPKISMLQVSLHQMMLVELANRHSLPTRYPQDVGYWAHLALQHMFGSKNPKPYQIVPSRGGPWITILGYMPRTSSEEAVEVARLNAPPDVENGVDWTTLRTKNMPDQWREGTVLNFDISCSPMRKVREPIGTWRAGAEVDEWLLHKTEGGTRDRYDHYCDWMKNGLEIAGCEVLSQMVTAFELESVIRRTHEEQRVARVVKVPRATLQGQIKVVNPHLFAHGIARGFGVHRAFGFGMLKVKTADCKF